MEELLPQIWNILIYVLIAAGAGLTAWLVKGKKIGAIGKEIGDVFKSYNSAIEDGTITADEWKALLKEIWEVFASIGLKLPKPPWMS